MKKESHFHSGPRSREINHGQKISVYTVSNTLDFNEYTAISLSQQHIVQVHEISTNSKMENMDDNLEGDITNRDILDFMKGFKKKVEEKMTIVTENVEHLRNETRQTEERNKKLSDNMNKRLQKLESEVKKMKVNIINEEEPKEKNKKTNKEVNTVKNTDDKRTKNTNKDTEEKER